MDIISTGGGFSDENQDQLLKTSNFAEPIYKASREPISVEIFEMFPLIKLIP